MPDESDLNYWREDPLLNEHHEHWHAVYPYVGLPDRKLNTAQQLLEEASDPDSAPAPYRTWSERQGELFVYMHAQLLARYSAERLSVGLPAVSPLREYREPIPEGYSPGITLRIKKQDWEIPDRPAGIKLKDLTIEKFAGRPGAKIDQQELFRDRLEKAVNSANRPVDICELGERVEPTDRLATSYFGALHNDGHLLISLYENDLNRRGCLFFEEAAVRDPVFYRWHQHIDSIFRAYQDTLKPHDFSELPPVVATGLSVSGPDAPNNLRTEMRTRPVVLSPVDMRQINYLSHDGFTYELTVENPSDEDVSVTVRIFLVPEKNLEDRRAWIEMDKFRRLMPAKRITRVTRNSTESSVIRHPALKPGALEGTEPKPDDRGVSKGCRCGWPYTLLLPRGSGDGMIFRVLALLTPGSDLLHVADEHSSASYCGVLDSKYPDQRPMGYPFDRPFDRKISDWLTEVNRPPQLTWTQLKITHWTQ